MFFVDDEGWGRDVLVLDMFWEFGLVLLLLGDNKVWEEEEEENSFSVLRCFLSIFFKYLVCFFICSWSICCIWKLISL